MQLGEEDAVIRLLIALRASVGDQLVVPGTVLSQALREYIYDYPHPSIIYVAKGPALVGGASDKPLGFVRVVVKPQEPFMFPTHIGEITDLYVVADARRQGVASALTRRAEEWLTYEGISELELYVRGDRTGASEFYANLGYHPSHLIMRKHLERK
jgi:ribosomal protein S18 acetylase RimI-like enzyme